MALENYTGYVETDPNGRYSVAANTITFTNLTRIEDAWVYDDKGVAHFGATFEHLVDTVWTARTNDGIYCVWAVSNVIDDIKFWIDNNSQAVFLWVHCRLGWSSLRTTDPSFQDDTSLGSTNNQNDHVWYEAERTSTTSISVRLYSDSGRTVLVDTITIALPSGRTYRYIFGINTHNSAAGHLCTGTNNNLDLQEAAPAGNRRRRMLIGA